MRKRAVPPSPSSTVLQPSLKRPKPSRRPDPLRHHPVPQWLHDAAAAFAASTPCLSWTGGFYSWSIWLNRLRHIHLWTPASPTSPSPPWRALVDACRASGQVHATAALHRAKIDLVIIIINIVYRNGEQQRLSNPHQQPAAERDIMRRVRAVVTRQRRHELASLTLIRFLDLAFVFSAYKHCRLSLPSSQPNSTNQHIASQVEAELHFFNGNPTANDIRQVTLRMQSFMWHHRCLPWYEQVPGVRNEMVIRAREAALAFCHGLPYPELTLRAGVRGLSRDHLAGAASMNEWLLTLFHPSITSRWARLSAVYEQAVKDERGEEDSLLEETSRRVVETVLAPLTEVKEQLDAAHSKLIDATPGIVVTQSVRIAGRFTFRQLLELHINIFIFAQCLHSTFYNCALPSIEQIHSGVLLFEEIRCRALDVRLLIDSQQTDALFNWCLSITDSHSQEKHMNPAAYKGCVSYQRAAIKAALRTAAMTFARNPKDPLPQSEVSEGDPLAYAAIIAEWDPSLAAKIIDAAVRINQDVRDRFTSGHGEGLDLYTHRRVLVCDAARETFGGDLKAASRLMMRLHPVWEVCEPDKCIGTFDERGALSLKTSVDRGNFEAAAVFGVLLCSDEWEERRRACHVKKDIEGGIVYICKAVAMGDTAAAGDLIHLLQVSPTTQARQVWNMPQRVADYILDCLQVASREEPSLSLFLGYIYSLGAPGIVADCNAAFKAYQTVLHLSTSTTYQAYAANNIGALIALNTPIDFKGGSAESTAREYFRTAAMTGNKKAESNLAAIVLQEEHENRKDHEMAIEIYGRCFKNPSDNSPVTVIQSDRQANEMKIFEMVVSGERQAMFCRDLKAEGMRVEEYGEVLQKETLPRMSKEAGKSLEIIAS